MGKAEQFQNEATEAEGNATMLAEMTGDRAGFRKRLEDQAYAVAAEEGVDKASAKKIIDGVLAQYDKDTVGFSADSIGSADLEEGLDLN